MKTPDIIANKIDRLPKGYVFTYLDFIPEVTNKEALIKSLNRMAEAGKIAKLSKGKYYKPEITPFGNLKPAQYQIVKDLLEDNGKVIGYLTGTSIYNELGLTTQVSNTIQIGRNTIRPDLKRDYYTISFIRQRNTITKHSIPLLQILDSIRFIRKIPDTTVSASCKRLFNIIEKLAMSDKETIVRLAMKYTPGTRAILGAMMAQLKKKELAEQLRQTLSPITSYKIKGIGEILTTAEQWNIR